MNWLNELFFGTGVSHSILVITLAIAAGVFLGNKLKIKGITLGITWVLFCGILLSHLGMRLDPMVESFAKDLGLILFVYSIGLQVGPSFFSSFGKSSLVLNLLAAGIVLVSCLLCLLLFWLTNVDLPTMVGVLFGAVTNTPGLGAAQAAYTDVTSMVNPNIASGYAIAYPLGVVGVIVSMLLIKWFFRVHLDDEEKLVLASQTKQEEIIRLDIRLTNQMIEGIYVRDLKDICHVNFVISRLIHPNGDETAVDGKTVLHLDDVIRVVMDKHDIKSVLLLGEEIKELETESNAPKHLVSRHVVVTKDKLNGKRIGNLRLRETYGVSFTRIRRAGIELLATHDLILQLGDRITVVGEEEAVNQVAKVVGNAEAHLNHPNVLCIFFGIVLGVILGSIPVLLPGGSQVFKLGLAGGTLIVSILIGAFGPRYHVVTYTTSSANLMIREIGIALFLAAVGLGAGKTFVPTLLNGGYVWIGYGAIITFVPMLLGGTIAKLLKLDYFTVIGLLAGSTTNPPALSYATAQSSKNDRVAVAYSTVYPFTMFLRVLTGQLLIILFL